MSPKDLERIIKQGEGLNIEFKHARKGMPADLFETVCAFLNRQGGHIVLGLQDNGTFKGVDPELTDQLKKDFSTLSNNPNKLNPPFLLDFTEVEVSGHNLLYVYVPQSSQVHRCDGIVFDRGHEGDFRVLDNNRIGQLFARKSAFYTENTIYPYLSLSDFKTGILNHARQLIRSWSPSHPWLALPDEELLRSAGLHRKDFQTGQEGYTLAAALLFGTDEVVQSVLPHYRIDAVVRIENMDRYDDRLDIRTNLIDAYDQLMQFIAKHLPDQFFLQGDQRVSLRDKIFREIVANLIVHREYTNGAPARLIIYADRVETDNANKPHGYGPINPEGFSPFPKNPYLAKFFQQMGRVEELGSGVRNVTHYLQFYAPGRTAQFMEEDMFKVIIPIPVSNKSPQVGAAGGVPVSCNTDNGGPIKVAIGGAIDELINEDVIKGAIEGVNKDVNERLIFILKAILQHHKLKPLQIATHFQVNERTIKRDLKFLKNNNFILFFGPKKSGFYKLTDKAYTLMSQ